MQTKRNGSIDLLKFLLILSITLYHGIKIWGSKKGVIFYNGGCAVEAFYIIAGFYMAKSAFEKQKDSVTYMWGRYKEVFPYHIFAFVCAFIYTCFNKGFFELPFLGSIKNIVLTAIKAVPDFLLLAPITGLQKGLSGINGIEWYLSAMLVGMALIYPFLKKWPRQFSCYIGPLVFLFGSGWLFQKNNGSYVITFDQIDGICGGLIRALATLAIGTTLYWLVKLAKEKLDLESKGLRGWITAASLICWIISFWYLITNQEHTLEFATIYLTAAGVFFACTGASYLNRPLSNKVTAFLAKLSFPMFLNQSWVRKLLIYIDLKGLGLSYAECMLVFVAAVIVSSLICMFVVDHIRAALKKRKLARQNLSA